MKDRAGIKHREVISISSLSALGEEVAKGDQRGWL